MRPETDHPHGSGVDRVGLTNPYRVLRGPGARQSAEVEEQ